MALHLQALKVFMATEVDGSVNYDKSMSNLRKELAEYELRQDEGKGQAARSVNEFFDKYKGARISTSFVVSSCLTALGAGPENYQDLTVAIKRYIESNTGSEGSLFGMKKGTGIWRWKDQAPSAK